MSFVIDSEDELRERMFLELEKVIDELADSNTINLIEYTIARDILWDCTLNHHSISIENNIAQDFISNIKEFVSKLHIGYLEFKESYPDSDNWDQDKINNVSVEFRDCAY